MVTYQSVLNAEYHKKLGKDAEPLEVVIQPFRVKVEELYEAYAKVLKHIEKLENELEVVNKKLRLLNERAISREFKQLEKE
jgi:hypothetical protein